MSHCKAQMVITIRDINTCTISISTRGFLCFSYILLLYLNLILLYYSKFNLISI